MCAHLGGTAANCSISPHLGTCVLVKVLLHLWDSSVLGILPSPITQRPSITPMRLAVIIISIMLPQWTWFTSLDMAPAPRQGVNTRLFFCRPPNLFLPAAFNERQRRRRRHSWQRSSFSYLWFVYKIADKAWEMGWIKFLNTSFAFAFLQNCHLFLTVAPLRMTITW